MMNSKSEIKSKDVRKVEKMAKKELRQQRLNQLYEKTLQELQHETCFTVLLQVHYIVNLSNIG